MDLPFSLPDWAPQWVGFALLVAGGLLAVAFLAMPFSVFGLKGRLDAVEARLDEIQREIRSLALRLPEQHVSEQRLPEQRRGEWEAEELPVRRSPEPMARPPIPPRAYEADRPAPPPGRRVAPSRTEPRFDA